MNAVKNIYDKLISESQKQGVKSVSGTRKA
jgi:hypothetical protein